MGIVTSWLCNDKEEIRYESESKQWKIRAAKHFIAKGMKPLPYAILDDVLKGLNAFFSSPKPKCEVYTIVVAGDSVKDTTLGKNLEKELLSPVFKGKVRVVNIAINRYGKTNKYADENINNLKELGVVCKKLMPDRVVLDQDNTYAKCFLKKSVDYKYKKSFMNRFGKGTAVRLGFGLFTIVDKLFSFVRINRRCLYKGSEDSLKVLFETFDSIGSSVLIASLCNRRTVKRLLKEAECLEYFQK